ncbi:MAG TPA: SgcJ/EcaC family oxidoreductase [Bryobacteraceae bacterium]|jgi:uncharacterized protein (TIGR02246 family)|nr:SgcJ/EcaC family oxidoreductase [Bryobacteraceae bacterium]
MQYQSPAAESPDAIAIRSLIDRMCDAWAAGDAAGYAGCFSEDSDYITYNGVHLRGQKENAELHGALFRGVLKGTRLSLRIDSIAFLSPGVALIHTSGAGPRRARDSSPRRKSLQTLVASMQDQGWRIRAFQNARIRPFSIWMTRLAARR